jgi:hypothetical protein
VNVTELKEELDNLQMAVRDQTKEVRRLHMSVQDIDKELSTLPHLKVYIGQLGGLIEQTAQWHLPKPAWLISA